MNPLDGLGKLFAQGIPRPKPVRKSGTPKLAKILKANSPPSQKPKETNTMFFTVKEKTQPVSTHLTRNLGGCLGIPSREIRKMESEEPKSGDPEPQRRIFPKGSLEERLAFSNAKQIRMNGFKP